MPSTATGSSTTPLYLGIDVGTGSARAAIFTGEGAQVGEAVACPIRLYKPKGHTLLYQQSSEDIWRAVCGAVRGALASGAVAASIESGARSVAGAGGGGGIESEGLCVTEDIRKRVVALAIDATCSLVVLGADDQPVSVTPKDTTVMEEEGGEEDIPNVILWLDHRATAEAAEINAKGRAGREGSDGEGGKAVASRLRLVGDNLSPENEVPKLLWLKRHLKKRVWGVEEEDEMEKEEKGKQPARDTGELQCQARFWDLGDYLSYRATKGEGGRGGGIAGGRDGAEKVRSLCCVASKWMYAQDEDGGGW
jgi:ribulose kinase